MTLLNAVAGRAIDLALWPFRQVPPLAGLTIVALATAVAVLLIFRKTSDQRAIASEKRQLQAAVYEVRLFSDDLRAILRAQAEIVRRNLKYLRLSLVPMLWVIAPLVLVIAQLQFHYGYADLQPGQSVLVKAQLRDGLPRTAAVQGLVDDDEPAVLEASADVDVQTRAIWFPATRELIWRVVPRAAGEYELRLRLGGETFGKSLRVSDEVARTSPVRIEAGFLNELLYPAEPPLPRGAPITAITVAYPASRITLFGWDLHWMLVYFLLSTIFALALRGPLGVTL